MRTRRTRRTRRPQRQARFQVQVWNKVEGFFKHADTEFGQTKEIVLYDVLKSPWRLGLGFGAGYGSGAGSGGSERSGLGPGWRSCSLVPEGL